MLNRDKLRAAMAGNKGFAGMKQDTGPRWGFLSTKEIADGQYPIRLMWPHEQKCPDGYVINSTYKIEVNTGDDGIVVLGPKSCDRPMLPCYYAERIAFQIIQKKLMSDFSPGMITALEKLVPWDRITIPILLFGEARVTGQKSGSGKNADKKYDIYEYHPGVGGPHPRIWEIPMDYEYSKQLMGLFDKYPDLNDANSGRVVIMQRSHNTFLFVPQAPSQVGPDIVNMWNNMFDIAKQRKKNYKEPEQIRDLIRSSWWYARLLRYGLDLRDDNEIMAQNPELLIPVWPDAETEVPAPYVNPAASLTAAAHQQQPPGMPSSAPPFKMDMSGLFNSLDPQVG